MSTLQDRQREFSYLHAKFVIWLYDNGYSVRKGDGWRRIDKLPCPHCGTPTNYQEALVKAGLSDTLQSKHADRLAEDDLIERRDGIPMSDGDWWLVGMEWESLGGRWGGTFGIPKSDYTLKIGKDRWHFELAE